MKNVLSFDLFEMVLYHGSPYDFNGFDLNINLKDSKDVHGYGIYLTDNEEVAKDYTIGKGRIIYKVDVLKTNFLNWNDVFKHFIAFMSKL